MSCCNNYQNCNCNTGNLSENNDKLKRELGDFVDLLRERVSDIAYDKNYQNILDSMNQTKQDLLDQMSGIILENTRVINVTEHGLLPSSVDRTDKLMELINSNPENTTFFFPDGEYHFSGVNIIKSGTHIVGQSKDKTIFKISRGSNGLAWRMGKRGPSTDTRGDNLPVYNGVNPVFDINDYSPEVPGSPRAKDMRVVNLTMDFQEDCTLGFEYYRVDGGVIDIVITGTGNPAVGNAFRMVFCTEIDIPRLTVGDFPNAVYNTFIYWSYGIRGGVWKTGSASSNGLEFKHGVNCRVERVESNNPRTETSHGNSLNIGYGSRDIHIEYFKGLGHVRVKASEEFNYSKNISFGHLEIYAPDTTALTLVGVWGFKVDTYFIKGSAGMYVTSQDWYAFSNDTAVTASKNSAHYVFDGNYDTSSISAGYSKYFIETFGCALRDATFGKGIIESIGDNHCLGLMSAGGVRGYDEKGVMQRGSFTGGKVIGHLPEYRIYPDDAGFKAPPHGIVNVDFGHMTINQHSTDYENYITIRQANPLINCTGDIYLPNTTTKILNSYYLDNVKIGIWQGSYSSNAKNTLIFRVLKDSTIYGELRCAGWAVEFNSSTNGKFYSEGVDRSILDINFLYKKQPLASPLLITRIEDENYWKGSLKVLGNLSYELPLAPPDILSNSTAIRLMQQNAIISHMGSKGTVNYGKSNGGGVNCKDFTILESHRPVRGIDGAYGSKPSSIPNYIGEICVNVREGVDERWVSDSKGQWHNERFAYSQALFGGTSDTPIRQAMPLGSMFVDEDKKELQVNMSNIGNYKMHFRDDARIGTTEQRPELAPNGWTFYDTTLGKLLVKISDGEWIEISNPEEPAPIDPTP